MRSPSCPMRDSPSSGPVFETMGLAKKSGMTELGFQFVDRQLRDRDAESAGFKEEGSAPQIAHPRRLAGTEFAKLEVFHRQQELAAPLNPGQSLAGIRQQAFRDGYHSRPPDAVCAEKTKHDNPKLDDKQVGAIIPSKSSVRIRVGFPRQKAKSGYRRSGTRPALGAPVSGRVVKGRRRFAGGPQLAGLCWRACKGFRG
jgi:hypothetical protein